MARDAQVAERLVVPTKYVRGWKEEREGGREDEIRRGERRAISSIAKQNK